MNKKQTYATKAAAKKGAIRANSKTHNFDIAEVTFQKMENDRWIWIDECDQSILDRTGGAFIHCPHCGIHLENGLVEHDYSITQAEVDAGEADYRNDTHELSCMACNGEFGNELSAAPWSAKKVTAPTGEGLKIEKNRPVSNGIARPSVSGKCRAVWDTCDALLAEHGEFPKPKMLKEVIAKSHPEVSPVTATVQLYRWRAFQSVEG